MKAYPPYKPRPSSQALCFLLRVASLWALFQAFILKNEGDTAPSISGQWKFPDISHAPDRERTFLVSPFLLTKPLSGLNIIDYL